MLSAEAKLVKCYDHMLLAEELAVLLDDLPHPARSRTLFDHLLDVFRLFRVSLRLCVHSHGLSSVHASSHVVGVIPAASHAASTAHAATAISTTTHVAAAIPTVPHVLAHAISSSPTASCEFPAAAIAAQRYNRTSLRMARLVQLHFKLHFLTNPNTAFLYLHFVDEDISAILLHGFLAIDESKAFLFAEGSYAAMVRWLPQGRVHLYSSLRRRWSQVLLRRPRFLESSVESSLQLAGFIITSSGISACWLCCRSIIAFGLWIFFGFFLLLRSIFFFSKKWSWLLVLRLRHEGLSLYVHRCL
mmetsp:Transcript_8150/g.14472  ORF Transcript_8150/g.14472 Transcript_8150/m.14472 type:complete len:302 (+) Transcript_8150:571-1476(+)